MLSTEKRDNQLEWICRILMTIDVFVVSAGYFYYFQASRQLKSPLIPRALVYQIVSGSHVMEASLIAGMLLLTGMWLYFFRRKLLAVVLFGLTIILFKVVSLVF